MMAEKHVFSCFIGRAHVTCILETMVLVFGSIYYLHLHALWLYVYSNTSTCMVRSKVERTYVINLYLYLLLSLN